MSTLLLAVSESVNVSVSVSVSVFYTCTCVLAYLSNNFAGNVHRTRGDGYGAGDEHFCIAKCLANIHIHPRYTRASLYLLPYFM